jgi:hypothetical protein
MKIRKPGQYYWHQKHQLRVMKRTCGCKGCVYEDCVLLCPNVLTRTNRDTRPDCELCNIIFVKV